MCENVYQSAICWDVCDDQTSTTNSVTYPGVTSGKAYGIFPKQKMLELVHHPLRVDADRPTDISRLIEAQIVGRTRRGVYADLTGSVEEINFPLT